MKRTILVLGGLAALGVALCACETVQGARDAFLKGEVLSYDQYRTAGDPTDNPQPTADTILKQLGQPRAVHDRDGVIRRLDYHSYSLNGDLKVAEFTFDENQRLTKKELW
jgi:hypothetical protein